MIRPIIKPIIRDIILNRTYSAPITETTPTVSLNYPNALGGNLQLKCMGIEGGSSEQDVDVVGKNLLDKNKFSEYLQSGFVNITSTGVSYTRKNGGAYSGARVPLFLPTGFSYKLSLNYSVVSGTCIAYLYNASMVEIGSMIIIGTSSGAYSTTVTPSEDVSYLLFSNGEGVAGENVITDLQVELGTIATAYEPYNATRLHIPALTEGETYSVTTTYRQGGSIVYSATPPQTTLQYETPY